MGKRRRGSGSIDRPTKTTRNYRIRWDYKGVTYIESTGTDDRAEAERILEQRIMECKLGLRGPEVKQGRTVGHLLDALIADYELHGRASLPQLRSRVEAHLRPALGRVKALDLGGAQIEGYKVRRKRAGAALSTINRELDHLRAALRLAHELGQLLRVPRVRLFREDNTRTGYLEDDKYRALRDALPGYLRPLFVVAFHTGARRGELLQLTWDRVDFAGKQIFMDPVTTKSRAPRTLPVYGDMQAVLSQAFAERNSGWPGSPLVFSNGGREIVDFRKAWTRACKAAGVGDLKFHDLRRTASRNMRRAEIPDLVIRRIIGHATDSMFRRYGIVDERDVRAAGRKAEEFLAERAGEVGPVDSDGRVH